MIKDKVGPLFAGSHNIDVCHAHSFNQHSWHL